jgi:CRISPR-associated protein Csx10
MKAIILTLETQQPILATSFQGDPNSDVSYSYIPGSMIRGAVIRRYMQQKKLSSLKLSNGEVQRLFFDANRTRYLNAYLLSQEKKRTLPLPLSWFKDKGAELKEDSDITVYDFSIDRRGAPETPKSLGEYFWVKERGLVKLYKEKRRINIHNFRDRQKGRSTDEQGEIFRYEALDAGQTFQSVILCEDEYVKIIQDLLAEPNLWLGGSQSAGYGQTKIVDRKPPIDNWNEIGVPSEDRENDELLSVTLLSDLIIRDDCGQYAAIPPTQLLAEVLGKKSEELETSRNEYKTYMDSVFVGGFNRKWGLPLPQVLAVKAGSVFVYEGVAVTAEQICQLETIGIGERTVEGFGRVAVNWRVENNRFTARKPEPKTYSKRNQPQLQESHDLARQMAERILRQKLEELLIDKVEEYKLNPNRMTNSQLSRLIIVTRQSLDINCRQPLDLLLDNLPSNARTKYDRTKVDGQLLNQKIKNWLDHPTSWIDGYLEPVAIANETAILSDELALEYTLRLIMAIAKNATKEKPNE